jgi:hypothetical protein
MGIRNAAKGGLKGGGMSHPSNHVAFTEPDVSKRGGKGNTPRVSRVKDTTHISGSGSAGS